MGYDFVAFDIITTNDSGHPCLTLLPPTTRNYARTLNVYPAATKLRILEDARTRGWTSSAEHMDCCFLAITASLAYQKWSPVVIR